MQHIHSLPSFQQKWAKSGYECVQNPGDILYVPQSMQHGTMNIDETVGMAVQGLPRTPEVLPRRPAERVVVD